MEKRSKQQPESDTALSKSLDVQLSPPQVAALEKLTGGDTLLDAARAAGVSRMTLHRWLKGDPHFAAAYNAWQEETLATARGRLLALTGDAVSAVATSIRAGDSKAALAILKSMGLLDRPTPGPTDPAIVAFDQKTAGEREVRRQISEAIEF